MAWIKQIELENAEGLLRHIYDRIAKARGKLSNVMKVHSLHPESMEAHLNFYLSLMFTKSGLSREEREMIAVAVSAVNKCAYCLNHHAEALLHFWKDRRRVELLSADVSGFELPNRQRCMVDYAVKLTRSPAEMTEEDIHLLGEGGLTDEEILLVNQVASYFNYVNRSVLGLGVEFAPDEIQGYRY